MTADGGRVVPDGEDAADPFFLDLAVEGVAAVVDDRDPAGGGSENLSLLWRGGPDHAALAPGRLEIGKPLPEEFLNPVGFYVKPGDGLDRPIPAGDDDRPGRRRPDHDSIDKDRLTRYTAPDLPHPATLRGGAHYGHERKPGLLRNFSREGHISTVPCIDGVVRALYVDESIQAAGDDISEYLAGLRRLSPVDQEGPAGESLEQDARPLVGAGHREARLPCSGPGHHPRDQNFAGREEGDHPLDIARIEDLRAVHHHDRGVHSILLVFCDHQVTVTMSSLWG